MVLDVLATLNRPFFQKMPFLSFSFVFSSADGLGSGLGSWPAIHDSEFSGGRIPLVLVQLGTSCTDLAFTRQAGWFVASVNEVLCFSNVIKHSGGEDHRVTKDSHMW